MFLAKKLVMVKELSSTPFGTWLQVLPSPPKTLPQKYDIDFQFYLPEMARNSSHHLAISHFCELLQREFPELLLLEPPHRSFCPNENLAQNATLWAGLNMTRVLNIVRQSMARGYAASFDARDWPLSSLGQLPQYSGEEKS